MWAVKNLFTEVLFLAIVYRGYTMLNVLGWSRKLTTIQHVKLTRFVIP